MKKGLIISVIVNILFLVLFGYIIHVKGGIPYLKLKLGLDSKNTSIVRSVNPYWDNRVTLFKELPNNPNEIIFLGNSITDYCEWSELFGNPSIINRGISGDRTDGVLRRLSEVTESKPSKVFIMIGVNDISGGVELNNITINYRGIIEKIKSDSPDTKIYIQSVLPTLNHPFVKNDSVVVLNQKLKNLSEEYSLTYINLYDSFKNQDGDLKEELSYDGLHLDGQGYMLWKSIIEPYITE